MRDEVDVLLEFHKIQIERSEHYESQRSTVSGLVLTLASALVALATFDDALTRSDLALCFLVMGCGLLGLASSRVYYFRSLRHGRRASAYREAMSAIYPSVDAIKRRVDKEHALAGRKGDLRLHQVWNALHLTIAVLGVILCVVALL